MSIICLTAITLNVITIALAIWMDQQSKRRWREYSNYREEHDDESTLQ